MISLARTTVALLAVGAIVNGANVPRASSNKCVTIESGYLVILVGASKNFPYIILENGLAPVLSHTRDAFLNDRARMAT